MKGQPTYKSYISVLTAKLASVEAVVSETQRDYSIAHLQKLYKELHEFADIMSLYGEAHNAFLLQRQELATLSKLKNFYYDSSHSWITSLSEVLKNVTTNLNISNGDTMVKVKQMIVIIEDDEDISKLLVYEFSQLGFEVTTFQTGGEALNLLSNEDKLKEVALIILDRLLPDMDGLEILKKLSKIRSGIPCLIISVLGSEADILSGLEEGAIDYITKPFSVFFLVQKALNLLKAKTK